MAPAPAAREKLTRSRRLGLSTRRALEILLPTLLSWFSSSLTDRSNPSVRARGNRAER